MCYCSVGYERFYKPEFWSEITRHGDTRFTPSDILYILMMFLMSASGQTRGSSDWTKALNTAGVKDKEMVILKRSLMHVPAP